KPKRSNSLRSTPENEVSRCAAVALCLGLITRRNIALPRYAPIGGAIGGPRERRRAQESFQGPGCVVGNVGCKMYGASRDERTRKCHDRLVLDHAALPVPALWPRVGIENIHADQ